MISRIYVIPARNATHNVAGGPKKGTRVDSYLIDSKFSKKELEKLAGALTNPIIENYTINESPIFPRLGNFSYAIEIGFLPGVTDNVGHTVKEIATDLLRSDVSFANLAVYTSKIFLTSGAEKDAEKLASTLYNPLIERAYI